MASKAETVCSQQKSPTKRSGINTLEYKIVRKNMATFVRSVEATNTQEMLQLKFSEREWTDPQPKKASYELLQIAIDRISNDASQHSVLLEMLHEISGLDQIKEKLAIISEESSNDPEETNKKSESSFLPSRAHDYSPQPPLQVHVYLGNVAPRYDTPMQEVQGDTTDTGRDVADTKLSSGFHTGMPIVQYFQGPESHSAEVKGSYSMGEGKRTERVIGHNPLPYPTPIREVHPSTYNNESATANAQRQREGLQKKVTELEHKLQEKEQKIDALLAQKEQISETLQSELQRSKKEIETASDNLNKIKCKLQQMQLQRNTEVARREKVEAVMEEKDKRDKDKDKLIQAKDKLIEEKDKRDKDKDKLIQAKDKLIEEKDKRDKDKDKLIQAKDKLIEEKDKRDKDKDKLIQAKDKLIEEKDKRDKDKDKLIQAKDKLIEEKDKRDKDKDKLIQAKDKLIEEKEKRIQDKDKELKDKEKQVQDKDKKNKELTRLLVWVHNEMPAEVNNLGKEFNRLLGIQMN